MNQRQINSTAYPFAFLLVLSSDKTTPYDGLAATVTVTIRKPGASFAAASGTVTKIGNGWYELAGNATDRSALGDLLLHATAKTCDPVDAKMEITDHDPFATARDANVVTVNGVAVTPVTGNIPADVKAIDATVQSSLITAIWGATTRSLTNFGTLVADAAAAVWAVTIRTITGGVLTTAPPTAAQVREELDANSTKLEAIDGKQDQILEVIQTKVSS